MLATPLAVLLVVIRDLDFVRPVNLPNEADAVLIVDSDAVLARAVALQRFQSIAWRDAQVAQVDGRFDLVQLAESNRSYGGPAPAGTRLKEFLRIGVFEALNHLQSGYDAWRDM